ncbi:RNA polymerase sigma factor [Paenibacillus sp. N3/727]|uniref:RNA polymerase sigma factor n=1 Tax=Paenibacillus sp. N3/727 TaxID=2925845 RepID=UPI001F52C664|nr:RNA polymerase sigma factor [Paenibacillus sp. N3/727]UNK15833.1 RNA polymerase sigma factor [Paenibacillus sp. N3/727]
MAFEAEDRASTANKVASIGMASFDRDQSLVERAQQGDTEAFGELIEQHRDKARSLAERLTGDPHMADDVVQDALIRAFMHMGTLVDTSRFLPWFYRIVRNQANMRLRRGGPHRNERPFVSISSPETNDSQVNWEDLDSILYHLARTATDAAMREQDPAEHLLRKELYETIHALLHCLNRKERDIFKAYFFRQLSPDEIAAMYRMTTGSIYTYIHRSRQKLRKEHIRVSLGLLPEKKGGGGLLKHKLIKMRPWQAEPPVMSTFVDSVGRMLTSEGDRWEAAELMGLSTFAFRMKLSDKTTFADGIYVFDWGATLQELMREIGYEISMLCGQLADSPIPLLGAVERFPIVLPIEEAVLPFIHRHIDAGKPVMYFDTLVTRPYVHEWSVIYGYDDRVRLVHLTDPIRPGGKTLSYDDVINNPVRFLAGIGNKLEQTSGETVRRLRETAAREQALRTIHFAITYAKHGCAYRPRTSYLNYTSGLAAYDRWIGHLRNPHIAPNRYGMGQLSAVYTEKKRYAALYLRGVPLEEEAKRLALLASEAYEQAAGAMAELCKLVPFIRTSEILSPDMREVSVEQLEKAKAFESVAIGYMENIIAVMAE